MRALDALARAPVPPSSTAEAAVRTSTELSWAPVPGVRTYRVWRRRRTDEAGWGAMPFASIEPPRNLAAGEDSPAELPFVETGGNTFDLQFSPQQITFELLGVRGDNWLFGVSAVADAGAESPVASAVPGGGFALIASTRSP